MANLSASNVHSFARGCTSALVATSHRGREARTPAAARCPGDRLRHQHLVGAQHSSGGRAASSATTAVAEREASTGELDSRSQFASDFTSARPAPVAAAPSTAISVQGAAGTTATEPVPIAEPSSLTDGPAATNPDAFLDTSSSSADSPGGRPAAAGSASGNGAQPAHEGSSTADMHSAASSRREDTSETSRPHGILVPEAARWFTRGDVVAGRVIWANARGARIATLQDERIIGYMPIKEGPFPLKEDVQDGAAGLQSGSWSDPCLPVGHVREFQVLSIPNDMAYGGRGPLLSARLVDLDMMWTRAEQVLRASKVGRETVQVAFTHMNEGGMMTRFLGLRLFMPLSHVHKPEPRTFFDQEGLKERYIHGGRTEVAITEVDVFGRRFVCSEAAAIEYAAVRAVQQGTLVWGTIRRLEDFGVFVGIDGTRISGLLHVSNISRQHVGYPDDVFRVGDRVRALVLAVEDGWSRISLSTAELEEESGDMLNNPDGVYANADEQVKFYLAAVRDEADVQDSSSHT